MDHIEARQKALEMAMSEARAGTSFVKVIENANMFADFTLNGTVPKEPEAKE